MKLTSNYCGIFLLSASYKILLNILSRLSPYIDDIIGDYLCGFQCKRSTTDIRFSAFMRHWRKKWEYNETEHQLFMDFKKAYAQLQGMYCTIFS
jgi:hypothetical protein